MGSNIMVDDDETPIAINEKLDENEEIVHQMPAAEQTFGPQRDMKRRQPASTQISQDHLRPKRPDNPQAPVPYFQDEKLNDKDE